MKRKVRARIDSYREPPPLRRGRKQGAEHGLGVAWASGKSHKPATGTPVIASGCNHSNMAQFLRPLLFCANGAGKPRWYHESFYKALVLVCISLQHEDESFFISLTVAGTAYKETAFAFHCF